MKIYTNSMVQDENGTSYYAPAVLHNTEAVDHIIDDDEGNKLTKPALLYVGGEEIGDIKVMFPNGAVHVIPKYNRSQTFMVVKVYAGGTEVQIANIKLYR